MLRPHLRSFVIMLVPNFLKKMIGDKTFTAIMVDEDGKFTGVLEGVDFVNSILRHQKNVNRSNVYKMM
jgi:hypothetical protein